MGIGRYRRLPLIACPVTEPRLRGESRGSQQGLRGARHDDESHHHSPGTSDSGKNLAGKKIHESSCKDACPECTPISHKPSIVLSGRCRPGYS